jgi:hypothetical protein
LVLSALDDEIWSSTGRSHGMNLALQLNSMQKHLSVITRKVGMVHINCQSGHLFWEEENLDPVLQQYAKKYLVQEGFVEQALGVLDPEPLQVPGLFLDDVRN